MLVNTSHAKDQIENQINQGTLFYNWGKLDNAYAAFKAAEHMLRSQAGLMLHKAVVANNMATVWRDRQEWVAAESYYQQSIRFYHQIGNQLQLARTMINLAKCHIQQKAPVAALAQLEKAHDLLEQTPYNKQVQLLRKEIAAQLTHLEPAKKSDKTASLPLSAPSAAT
ncbi:MAG: tetratricopeptide repeat protein [Anaerolineales bacterium]|nr:tetratricopeptide repeat protein [Anaerolineales bacterium]